jgi:hypothetical protein
MAVVVVYYFLIVVVEQCWLRLLLWYRHNSHNNPLGEELLHLGHEYLQLVVLIQQLGIQTNIEIRYI